jgi:Tol biopolymer transport system component
LVWFNRTGREIGTVGEADSYSDLRLSPNGRFAAIVRAEGQRSNGHIWVLEVDRPGMTRVTREPGYYGYLAWSPDSTRLAFASIRHGSADLYRVSAAGGDVTLLYHSDSIKAPEDWSRDGKLLLFNDSSTGLWVLPFEGEPEPDLFLQTGFQIGLARFSPDGAHVAYTSMESGKPAVFVLPVRRPGDRRLVSSNGGWIPRWRRDGREIYYASVDGQIWAAPVVPGPNFDVGVPALLFKFPQAPPSLSEYDVSADGERFLVLVPAGEARSTPLTLITNWSLQQPR